MESACVTALLFRTDLSTHIPDGFRVPSPPNPSGISSGALSSSSLVLPYPRAGWRGAADIPFGSNPELLKG